MRESHKTPTTAALCREGAVVGLDDTAVISTTLLDVWYWLEDGTMVAAISVRDNGIATTSIVAVMLGTAG